MASCLHLCGRKLLEFWLCIHYSKDFIPSIACCKGCNRDGFYNFTTILYKWRCLKVISFYLVEGISMYRTLSFLTQWGFVLLIFTMLHGMAMILLVSYCILGIASHCKTWFCKLKLNKNGDVGFVSLTSHHKIVIHFNFNLQALWIRIFVS